MNRSVVLLLVVALVLGGLVLLFANPFQDSIRTDPGERESLLEPGDLSTADRITIVAVGDTTVLARRDDAWVVESRGGFFADTAAVGTILRSVAGARSLSVVSRNPDKRNSFAVDETGVGVRVDGGRGGPVDLIVGKAGRDFTTSYVRLADEDAVHVVRGINKNMFTRPQGFRDRTLMAFDRADVARISLRESGAIGWVLANADTMWTVEVPGAQPEAAAQTAVDQVVRTLSTLTADGFADPDTVWSGEERRVEVLLKNGASFEVALSSVTGQSQVPARRPDRNATYLLGKWRVDSIAKSYEDLLPQES